MRILLSVVAVAALLCCVPHRCFASAKDVVCRARVGLASWYGKERLGHRTTSGAFFQPNRLTAASWDVPLGSRVRVTNLRNGRHVIVLVNDRGPSRRLRATRGRIIDLSRAAAERLGFISEGVTRVRVELVSLPRKTLILAER